MEDEKEETIIEQEPEESEGKEEVADEIAAEAPAVPSESEGKDLEKVGKLVPKSDKLDDKSIDGPVYDPAVGNLKPRDLNHEMETSYLDYAMSVIVSRALPDVRDGLKPVHRRVIYAMHDTGLTHAAKYRKSAKVVGEVIGNYHPHGDVAVYDTLVRLAQDFSMRYRLVDGQGNFGSMDGDSAAAMRYTECRMTALAGELVADIDKDTIDWQDNYDGSTKEPKVMPARVPQLLLNGAMGIAVGMATNIPPHNLTELANGIIHLIDNPEATVEDLMQFIQGPDFPTGANIYNTEDIKMAYATGKGRIMMRAKAEIEETKRGFRIIISEIPYQVNKASLIEKIAELVKNKRVDGISDIRDESDRTQAVRVVVELKSSAYPKKVLNRLFELTPMQTAFHVNMLALTPDLEPRVMTLRDICQFYVAHRQEVIERRTKFELKKAEERAHILEGLKIALDHIDEVISTIRSSANREEAHKNLMAKFGLSTIQSNAILDMRLSSLAALERKRIEEEYEEVLRTIDYLKDLLAHPEKILGLIKADLKDVIKRFGDERRTTIIPHALGEFRAEDLIPDEQVIVSISRSNYVKRQDVNSYRKQIRGGVGIVGMTTKEEDIVDYLACANTHDDVFFFTDKGRVFKSKVYELPATSRLAKGTPIVNIIQLSPNETVTAVLTIPKGKNNNKFFVMGTKDGQIKKTEISQYDNIRKTGIIAIGLKGKDELKWVKTTSGEDAVVEVTEKGQAICYLESDARPMGRSASGVTGMRLKNGDKIMSMDIVPQKYFSTDNSVGQSGADMLVVLENGFGKRTSLNHFHLQKRGGYGMRAANCTERTGNLIGMNITYSNEGDVVLASRNGQFIRLALVNIKRLGRDTQGVTLMKLRPGDKVASVALLLANSDEIVGLDQGDLVEARSEALIDKPLKSSDADGVYESPEETKKEHKGKPSIKKRDEIATTGEEVANKVEEGSLTEEISQPTPSDLHVKAYSDKVIVDDNGGDTTDSGADSSESKEVNYWGRK
ncbi:MAG: DNA gyrase subunit A [Patescibacteria group bacterium]|jgi:DNA gyrase subunit A